NIECIYLNCYERATAPYELIILVSNKYIKTLGGLVPKILYSIREFTQYRVLCYIAFQAKDKIRQGNLFLFTSCQPHKLIYQKENSDFLPVPKNFDLERCMELTMALHDRERQKIDEFKEGYYYFKDHGKYPLASFMLHQAMELTYRYLQLLLVAKERITHSIRCHHLYLKEISAMYVSIFDEERDTDIYLLQILEDIYRATRYEDNFQIDIDVLEQLERKMLSLHTNAGDIFDHFQDTA